MTGENFKMKISKTIKIFSSCHPLKHFLICVVRRKFIFGDKLYRRVIKRVPVVIREPETIFLFAKDSFRRLSSFEGKHVLERISAWSLLSRFFLKNAFSWSLGRIIEEMFSKRFPTLERDEKQLLAFKPLLKTSIDGIYVWKRAEKYQILAGSLKLEIVVLSARSGH